MLMMSKPGACRRMRGDALLRDAKRRHADTRRRAGGELVGEQRGRYRIASIAQIERATTTYPVRRSERAERAGRPRQPPVARRCDRTGGVHCATRARPQSTPRTLSTRIRRPRRRSRRCGVRRFRAGRRPDIGRGLNTAKPPRGQTFEAGVSARPLRVIAARAPDRGRRAGRRYARCRSTAAPFLPSRLPSRARPATTGGASSMPDASRATSCRRC